MTIIEFIELFISQYPKNVPKLIITTFKNIDGEIDRYYKLEIKIDNYCLFMEPHKIELFQYKDNSKIKIEDSTSNLDYEEYKSLRNNVLIHLENIFNIPIEKYSFGLIHFI